LGVERTDGLERRETLGALLVGADLREVVARLEERWGVRLLLRGATVPRLEPRERLVERSTRLEERCGMRLEVRGATVPRLELPERLVERSTRLEERCGMRLEVRGATVPRLELPERPAERSTRLEERCGMRLEVRGATVLRLELLLRLETPERVVADRTPLARSTGATVRPELLDPAREGVPERTPAVPVRLREGEAAEEERTEPAFVRPLVPARTPLVDPAAVPARPVRKSRTDWATRRCCWSKVGRAEALTLCPDRVERLDATLLRTDPALAARTTLPWLERAGTTGI